jgi:NAD+ kinase
VQGAGPVTFAIWSLQSRTIIGSMFDHPQRPTRLKKVAIVSKPGRPELTKVLPEICSWLRDRGITVVIDRESQGYCPCDQVFDRQGLGSQSPDLALVLGGDGTLLSASRAVSQAGTLILGINLGTLGFLTERPLADLYPALEAIEKGEYIIDSRAMLSCSLRREDATVAVHQALNDVVVSKSAISRLNYFELLVDGEFVSSYKADALIVATPTGSTAYSLGAGGPILTPDVDAFVITPVSPHGLTHRPVVVRDTVEIEIRVKTGDEAGYLSLDGQIGMPLRDGDSVRCAKAPHAANLLRFQKTFFEVLRTKLKWGEQ